MTEALTRRVDALAARLQAVEDREAITRVLYTLAQAIDYGDHPRWLDCFAEDAAFRMVEVGPTDRTVRAEHHGREALAAFIPGHTHAPLHPHKHLVLDALVEVDGDEATATSYLVRVDKGEHGPQFWSFGRYLDEFVRGSDGRWRMRARVIEVESRAVPVRPTDIGAPN